MTFANLIATIQLDFPEASDTELLADLQVIHNELCFQYKLIKSTQSNTALVAGTATYALPSNTARVYQVRYWENATTYTALVETSEDELDATRRRWRVEAAGTPRMFTVDSGYMTVVPAPGTSTSGGYPKLTFEVASMQPSILGSDTLPSYLPDHEAWVNGAKMRFALRHKDERYQEYKQMFMDSRALLAQQVNNFPARYQPQYRPGIQSGLGKV